MLQKILLVLIIFLAFTLRVFKLGEVPSSLYWDEASLGYNAYSISQTLRDEHGEFLPVTRFIAFGDYKPVGYIYAAAASIKLFGLSEFSIRFPSALAGTLLILITYFLAKELFRNPNLALIASALVAISPWSLQMSRGAFEANLATLFSGTGILFFIKGVKNKSLSSYVLASLFLILSMYTFNSHRVFVPLIIGALSIVFIKEIFNQKKRYILFLISCFLFLLPLIPYFLNRESRLRFEEVSWTKDLAPIEESNQRIALDSNNLFSKIIHNRRVSYTLQFLKHYSDHFRPDFLFYKGDVNLRLGTGGIGEMYWVELPFFLAGLYFLIKKRDKFSAFIFAWLLLAPIPAAMARETPHALRFLNVLPIPQIITAYGIFKLLNFKLLYLPLAIIYLVFFGFYLHDYYVNYPVRSEMNWQSGYKEMVRHVASVEQNYPCVNITQYYGRPYIYFLLYNQYPPQKYWSARKTDRDWYGFWYVHSFGKYSFDSSENKNCLYVSAPQETPKDVKIIYKTPVFVFYEKI
ncbi:MAG: glycosyltransferase family 39 protein [Patescibacteria group bacterium]